MTDKEFSDAQQALIEKLAYGVGNSIAAKLRDDFHNEILLHQSQCPVNQVIQAAKIKAANLEKTEEGSEIANAFNLVVQSKWGKKHIVGGIAAALIGAAPYVYFVFDRLAVSMGYVKAVTDNVTK